MFSTDTFIAISEVDWSHSTAKIKPLYFNLLLNMLKNTKLPQLS